MRGIRHATMLYSYLLRPTTAQHELPDVVLRHFNVTLSGAPGERADQLQRLAPLLRQEVEAQELAAVYEEIDLPLAPVLATMERHGIRVDPAALAAMSASMESEIRALERRIWELAGAEFNINSPQQLAEILFDKMNLATAGKRSRARARSTAADVLTELGAPARTASQGARISRTDQAQIHLRRRASPADRSRHRPPAHAPQPDRRRHRPAQLLRSQSAKHSRAHANSAAQIRAAFVADPGWTLLSADYSQIELRILAHFSEDPVLIEAFRTGQDIHARTAQEVFGVGPMAQTPEHRRAAKVINFGIIYGLSPFGLAQQLGIEQKEAARFIAAYFERYRGVKKYLDRSLEETRRTGFTRTLLRPPPPDSRDHLAARQSAQPGRTHRAQYAAARHRRRPHQAGHDRTSSANSPRKSSAPA